jgi:C-terminal processing protease CtpA/Prc
MLYANKEGTYPKPNPEFLSGLEQDVNKADISSNTLAFRLGDSITTFNVFQHFYPYFNEVNVNWKSELRNALENSFKDDSLEEHIITLQKLTAKLKDGHIRVSGGDFGNFAPPFAWEWVEGKLVITKVDSKLDLKVGDVITRINKIPSKAYFEEINSRISAGTKGWLEHRAETEAIRGKENSKIVLEINGKEAQIYRSINLRQYLSMYGEAKEQFKKINDEVSYLNIDLISMDSINKLMPQLEDSKSIICDLRGYPNGNHELISHFLKTKDTTEVWMKVPKTIYPNQENKIGYNDLNWGMPAKKPYLGDKQIIFIIDGSAISYAESYMGYIEGYKLATIIGQPTAGANGNVNVFTLPGNIRISFTGMKVVKHNGEKHHAVGIIPDILVSKTIKGIKEGRDEFLEKAISLTKSN